MEKTTVEQQVGHYPHNSLSKRQSVSEALLALFRLFEYFVIVRYNGIVERPSRMGETSRLTSRCCLVAAVIVLLLTCLILAGALLTLNVFLKEDVCMTPGCIHTGASHTFH